MREILFRGKTKDGEWEYGYFVGGVVRGGVFGYIMSNNVTEQKLVFKKTVGQYTGLTDKNGKKIFEGDIVKICSSNWWCGHTNNQLEKEKCTIYYSERTACFKFNDGKFDYSFNGYLYNDSDKRYSLEIIGNIHDNPELLEVQNG